MLVHVRNSKIYDFSGISPDQLDIVLQMFLDMPVARGVQVTTDGKSITVIFPQSESIKRQVKEILNHDFYYYEKRGTIREILMSFMLTKFTSSHHNIPIGNLFAGTQQINGAYIVNNPSLMGELMFVMHYFGFQNPSYEGTVRSSASEGSNIYYMVLLGDVEAYPCAKMQFPDQYIEEMLQ